MKYIVELTVIDNGALLTLTQSQHYKYTDAVKNARSIATEWAKKYGYDEPVPHVGFFTIHKGGITVAQTAIRS